MPKRPGNPRPKLNSDVLDVIEAVEKKPHATYIKYLLTKRAGLNMITDEMHKLGLSCPSTEYLKKYFQVQMEPLIRKNGLVSLYSEYKAKINGRVVAKSKKATKNEFISSILKYAIDIGDEPVLQAKFCTFIKEMGVEVPWAWEINRFHGTVENYPKDSNGVRILSSGLSKANVNRVAASPNRSIIEKLMLQNISNARISKYCKESLKEDINEKDLGAFREVFFNTQLNSLEDNIKMLQDEKKAQLAIIHDIRQSTAEYEEMPIGERAELERIINRRVNEIDENLRAINAAYNDLSYDAKAESENNFEAMFADIAKRAYRKYCSYDNANDRDVAGPLAQVSKVMIAAHDKIERIRESAAGSNKSSSLDDDGVKHAIGNLYRGRLDEIEAEEKEKANERLRQSGLLILDTDVNPDEIGGVEELGAEFKAEDEEDEK